MSASETLWEGDSPRLDETDIRDVDFPERELLLKRKAILLEEFVRNGGMEPRSVEDRCKILQQRIDSLEADLARAGTLDAARRYIEHAPQSDFDSINRHDFMAWFARSQPPQRSFSQPDRNSVIPRMRAMSYLAGDSFHGEGSLSGKAGSHRSKRRRIAENEIPPCLRCKILKKRCDTLDHCGHCPEQSFESGLDFWKVLGCFRESLRGLSSVFCPHFSRSIRRVLRLRKGGTETIHFLLIESRVSEQKKGRILHLLCTAPRFASLGDSSWEDVHNRQSLGFAAASFEQAGEEHITLDGEQIQTEDYEAPWAILQALSMDEKYLGRTEYNFFTLVRQGNRISKLEPNSWGLYTLAKRLLRQSVEVYLLERLCSSIASGDMMGPSPFFRSSTAAPNTLILVDIKADIERFLSDFEVVCSGRAKLTGHSQLACFYALLVFGIAKSMLIDTYSIRAEHDNENSWKDTDAVVIASAYKTLVSCFCWSSKTDMILDNGHIDPETAFGSALQDTRVMVHQAQWRTRNYRSTKDFLLGLGSGFLSGENYNGFLVQKYGLGTPPTSPLRSAATAVTEGYHSYGNESLALRSSPIFSSRKSRSTGEDSETFTPDIFDVTDAENISVSNIPSASQTDQRSLVQLALPAKPLRSSSDALARCPSTFKFVQNDVIHRERRRHGGRTGALSEDTLKRSREVRKLGSCWNCWIIRMACSEGTPCDRCLRLQGPEDHTCFRTPFTSYAETLFPGYLVSEYSLRAIESLLTNETKKFTDQPTEIEITWSSGIATKIGATVYIPSVALQRAYENGAGQLLGVGSLPIGVAASEPSMLEEACLTWLEQGLLEPKSSFIGFGQRTSNISEAVLTSIIAFNASIQTGKSLLHNFITAYLALHAISRPILFTDKSAESIRAKFKLENCNATMYSSRLLNLQLKHGMFNVARRTLLEALGQLEKTFRDRDKTLWPVLLNNYEHAQNSAVPHVGMEPCGESWLSCQAIEAGPLTQISHVFHLRYRTKKKDSAGLNPMKVGFSNTADIGFKESDMSFIYKIRNILMGNGISSSVLRERLLDQSGTGNDFAQRNSGRLVTKFLLSFTEQGDGQRS